MTASARYAVSDEVDSSEDVPKLNDNSSYDASEFHQANASWKGLGNLGPERERKIVVMASLISGVFQPVENSYYSVLLPDELVSTMF